jgi:SP family general alpha glucoside:H+ symporter-like MFS transporter
MADEKEIQQPSTTAAAPHSTHDHDGDHKRAADRVISDARLATEKEHKMTLMQGIRLYPKAIGWSVLISTCIVMEGYDVCLLNNFFGFPQFKRKYGSQLPDGTYEIPAKWQAGLSNGVIVGEIIGLFLNGWVSEAIGYRYTVMACLLLIIAFTAIFFTAQTVVHLLVAEILCGIPWGVFQTLTITYASEVCPVALRGYCRLNLFTLNLGEKLIMSSDNICQLLLGSRSGHWHRCDSIHVGPRRRVVLPHSLRAAMDVACSLDDWSLPCA